MSIVVPGEVVPVYVLPTDMSTPMAGRAIVPRAPIASPPLLNWGTAAGAILGPGNSWAPPDAPAPAPGPDPGAPASSSGCGCG